MQIHLWIHIVAFFQSSKTSLLEKQLQFAYDTHRCDFLFCLFFVFVFFVVVVVVFQEGYSFWVLIEVWFRQLFLIQTPCTTRWTTSIPKTRHLKLVPAILQSFSLTLYKKDTSLKQTPRVDLLHSWVIFFWLFIM